MPLQRSGAHNQLGAAGEKLAAEFLLGKKYILLAQNLVMPQGEVDLLMQDGETLVVVEVKTQTVAGQIDPIYKIGPAKQRKLRLLASVLAAKHPERNIRIDALTLYWNHPEKDPVITHLQNIL